MKGSPIIPEFTAENHQYTVAGIRKASVTRIIGEWIEVKLYGDTVFVHITSGTVIPGDIMLRAGDYGRAVHKIAFHLFNGHSIAWDQLNPILLPAAKQLSLFIERYAPSIVSCEQPMYSAKYDYVGTGDLYCWIKNHKTLDLIDIKTGGYDMAGPQTAAYEQLYREYSGYTKPITRWVLHLPKDGSDFLFLPLNRRDDFQYFLHKKAQYDWLNKTL